MSDVTPNVVSDSPAKAAPRTHAEIARRVQGEIDESVQVAATSQKPAYATVLHDDFDIDPQDVAALALKSAQAKLLAAQILEARRDALVDTAEAQTDRDHLVAAIDRVQTGARLKFDRLTDETQKRRELQRYYVGTDLHSVSGARLDTIAEAILLQLADETLPSVKAAQIQALRDALDDFRDETNDSPDAQALYEQLVVLIGEMKPLRRAIQIAADAAFPFRDTANAAARRDFDLPANRPFA